MDNEISEYSDNSVSPQTPESDESAFDSAKDNSSEAGETTSPASAAFSETEGSGESDTDTDNKLKETPEMSEMSEISEISAPQKTADLPETSETAETPDIPDITDNTETSEPPELPETAETPEPAEAAKTSVISETPEIPEPAETPEKSDSDGKEAEPGPIAAFAAAVLPVIKKAADGIAETAGKAAAAALPVIKKAARGIAQAASAAWAVALPALKKLGAALYTAANRLLHKAGSALANAPSAIGRGAAELWGRLPRRFRIAALFGAFILLLALMSAAAVAVDGMIPYGLEEVLPDSYETTDVSASRINPNFVEYTGTVEISLDYMGGGHENRVCERITVGELLNDLCDESGKIYETNYPLDRVLTDGMHIEISLIEYLHETRTEEVPYGVTNVEVRSIPKGTSVVTSNGVPGSAEREYQVRLVNGERGSEKLISEKVIIEPVNELVCTGVGGTFKDRRGRSYSYSYYVDVEATAYGVDTGKGGDNPYTYTGKPVAVGMIAVDPEMIPLGSKVFVTGDYAEIGVCYAEDIGSAIIGERIDIYMGKDLAKQMAFGRRSMRVYILE